MTAWLGRHRITKIGWLGRREIFVDLVSDRTDRLYQLYSGRRLIGTTVTTTERRVTGQVQPSDAMIPITIVSVPVADRFTDYGSQLPSWPWSRYKLKWNAASYPADAKLFEITSGTTPGGAVDSTNVVARTLFKGDGDYEQELPPIPKSGEWNYEITPVDDSKPNGNKGTAATAQINALVPPLDLLMRSDGTRFTVSAASAVASFDFTYQT